MKRVFLTVLDAVGAGYLPDAEKYGDVGANTFGHTVDVCHPKLPNLAKIGLGQIEATHYPADPDAEGAFGRCVEVSAGKDTTTGHWEISGIVTENPFPTFTETGFPKELMDKFEAAIGRKTLGNYSASGTVIINELGDEHVKTGYPIVYTSADSVFQIACHEDVIPVDELYKICETARELLVGDYAVARVIARPFIGKGNGNYTRTERRKDFSLAPTSTTVLDLIKEKGMDVAAIGKIEDIFEHRGMTMTTNNNDGIDKTIEFLKKDFEGLLFTNLVDTDMIYGHRNDVKGYAEALMYFDSKLPEIQSAMKDEDILIITADHGCDPTTPSTDHSREYVPLLVCGKHVKENINLGTRKTFADVGATVAEYLGIDERFGATSFLKDILK